MATLPVRRGNGRNLTIVNPSREFEDIYDRVGQLMNLAFGLAPVDVAEGRSSSTPTCPVTSTPTA
jgi:hypothetical protein